MSQPDPPQINGGQNGSVKESDNSTPRDTPVGQSPFPYQLLHEILFVQIDEWIESTKSVCFRQASYLIFEPMQLSAATILLSPGKKISNPYPDDHLLNEWDPFEIKFVPPFLPN